MSNKKNDIMTSLIIDNIGEKIFLKIISGGKEYINKLDNSRENFDELVKIIFNFLQKNNINLCKINNIPVFTKNFSLVETYSADEAFLTGTFGAQTPVATIDGKPIGENKGAGPMTKRLQNLYVELIKQNTT